MKIYLAGPINGCTDDEANSWRDQVKARFGEDRCLDPMRRDYRGIEDESVDEIVAGDLEDIEASDIVLANCWTPSVGTAMELWFAHRELSRPIVAIVPPGARVSPWVRYVATSVHTSLDEACEEVFELSAS